MAQVRNTIQKSQIYTALSELGNHPTADEVYARVHESSPKISRATVYRVLNQMADSGRILRIGVWGAAAHFDHRADFHTHVRCIACGRVCDIDDEIEISPKLSELKAKDFKILGCNILLDGICRSCEEKSEIRR